MDAMGANATDLEAELGWLARVIDARMNAYFERDQVGDGASTRVLPNDLRGSSSHYAEFLREHAPSYAERVALVLGLVPHVRPQLLDVFFLRNRTFDRRFTEFGGVMTDAGFFPTVETLAFVLGGTDLATRFGVQRLFEPDHYFARRDILRAVPPRHAGPGSRCQATLELSPEYVGLLTTGETWRPCLGRDFPAQHIETALSWSDLVLHPGTLRQVEEIQTWIEHGHTLMNDWGMASKLRPGHRSLFYGPPGTGKTATACLLGRATGREVYRVELSMIVSKYIGETAKNLARVLDRAERREWILVFDEADSLFGKRTATRDAHDRYANQEVSFLLQRLETFDGIAILASNLRDNIDAAFARRFESVVCFPLPRPEERVRLWRQGFSAEATFDASVDLAAISRAHNLSGGSIMNVIRYASLQALKGAGRPISEADLLAGIRCERAKEGKAA